MAHRASRDLGALAGGGSRWSDRPRTNDCRRGRIGDRRGALVGAFRGTISVVSAPTTTPRLAATPASPTHPCVRCGAPVAIEVGLCERCNPLGLRDSSASQVHGIAIGGVTLAIVLLAIF